MNPKEVQTAALKREVQLLRAENAYLRGQMNTTGSASEARLTHVAVAVAPARSTKVSMMVHKGPLVKAEDPLCLEVLDQHEACPSAILQQPLHSICSLISLRNRIGGVSPIGMYLFWVHNIIWCMPCNVSKWCVGHNRAFGGSTSHVDSLWAREWAPSCHQWGAY